MKRIFLIFVFLLNMLSVASSSSYVWQCVYTADFDMIFDGIKRADSMNIMALSSYHGAFPYLLKSTDAGFTWNSVYVDTVLFETKSWYPNTLAYPTKDFCIFTCDSNKYFKTTDGGMTWTNHHVDLPYLFKGFTYLSMYNEKIGVMASSYQMIISHDGFETWEQLQLPGSYHILDVNMNSPNTINYICLKYDGSPKYDEKFIRSKDGGKTWQEFPYPDYKFPNSLCFWDTLNGFIPGQDPINIGDQSRDLIYKTTDGGETWSKCLDTICWPQFGLTNLAMFGPENAVSVGQFGKIYWTHNGGQSWQRDSNIAIISAIPATMYVCMIGENTALTADFFGRIFRSYIETDVAETNRYKINSIFPNPARDYLNISVGANGCSPESVKIFDVFGQEEHLTPTPSYEEGELRVDVSALPPGVFFVRVGTKVNKFIKY